MRKRRILILASILVSFLLTKNGLAQDTIDSVTEQKHTQVVKAKGVSLLGEIESLIPQIRSRQTRIEAQLQAAKLLYDSDKRRASKLFADAIAEYKQLLASVDVNDRRYLEHYTEISELRSEIVQDLATYDCEAALNFVSSTLLPANPGGSHARDMSEATLEISIATQIMNKDPQRAVQIARKTLKTSYSPELLTIVSQLQAQNRALASELSNEIADKLLNENLLKNFQAANLALALIRLSVPTSDKVQVTITTERATNPTLLSADQYRNLLRKIYAEALSFSGTSPAYTPEAMIVLTLLNGLQSMGAGLDTIVAGGKTAVDNRISDLNPAVQNQQPARQYEKIFENSDLDATLQTIENEPEETRESLYVQLANRLASQGKTAPAKQILNERVSNLYERFQGLGQLEQQAITEAMNKGNVEEALEYIAALSDSSERAAQLTEIADQIATGQKRAKAIRLLEKARSLLGPSVQARDEEHLQALLAIARAFSVHNSQRAFEIVEPLIEQLNDICTAARTLQGFGDEYFEDDELNLRSESSVAHIANEISGALGELALTDFERAKSAIQRIRLPEVRLRAYLDIAQQTILGDEEGSFEGSNR